MTWQPAQYDRFKAERAQPFHDLVALIRPLPPPRVLDIGCGTGSLTRELHDALKARDTLGIDSSAEMLEKARALETTSLHFRQSDIESFTSHEQFDLIFSNAALHWVDDHPSLFRHLRSFLKPDGQLAIQIPANETHLSHRTAAEVAQEEPFRTELSGHTRISSVLAPEDYAELLYDLGFREQHVELRVYGHELDDVADVVEWVKGALLTDYARRMAPASYERFVERYRERLARVIGPKRAYFYSYKRILIRGRLA